MKTENTASKRAFRGILAGVFGIMLVWNILTPYLSDDFTFSYSFADRDTLHSPYILFRSIYHHYFDWSGRVIVKFFAQLFTIPPKGLFDVVNAGMFVLLIFIIYRLGAGRQKKAPDFWLLLGILLSQFLISPVFGQVNLWMCGSCNNLWSTLGSLAFLLPWRFYLEKPFETKRWMLPVAFFGGIAAGWLYENVVAGMLVCIFLAMVGVWFTRRELPTWMPVGFLGGCIGYLFLMLAPGNYVRTDDSSSAIRASFWDYVVRTEKAIFLLLRYGWPLLLAFFVLLFLVRKRTKDISRLIWPIILFLGSMTAHFAMVFSPVYYLRSTHGPFALLTAACAACLAQVTDAGIRRYIKGLFALLSVWAVVVAIFAGFDIWSYHRLYQERDAEIRAAVAAGETQIETYSIVPNTRYCGAFGLPDIRRKEDWISMTRCMWYGLDGLGLKTGEQASITADDNAPVGYKPLLGLNIGGGQTD